MAGGVFRFPISQAPSERQCPIADANEPPNTLKPGAHNLRLIAVDAGVVVDKIVIDLGGMKPSYDGPAETRLH